MGKLVSISVWRSRHGRGPPTTEEEAARLRGFVRWKRHNKALMDERDYGTKAPAVTPRPWPPLDRQAKH